MGKDLDEIIEELEEFKRMLPDLDARIIKQTKKRIGPELQEIAMSEIDDYYDSYTPVKYRRTGSLKSIVKNGLYEKKGDPDINLYDSTLIPDTHRVNSKYIYKKMFSEGWHGGADFGKEILWVPTIPRRGNPEYDGTYSPWKDKSIKAKWKPAVQSDSPKDNIEYRIKSYYNDEDPETGYSMTASLREVTDDIYGEYSIYHDIIGE